MAATLFSRVHERSRQCRAYTWIGLLLSIVALSCILSASAQELVESGSTAKRAQLTGLANENELLFTIGDQARAVALDKLIRWGDLNEADHGSQVLLVDGGLLVADVIGSTDERLQVDGPSTGTLELPLEQVAGIVFRPPADPDRRDALLARLRAGSGEHDLLLLENGDELHGTAQTLGSAKIGFDAGGGAVDVETLRIVALGFDPALRARKAGGSRTLVGLKDGSRLLATRLEPKEEAKVRMVLAEKVLIETAVKNIVLVQPLGGSAVYLSDLKPSAYKHVPFLSIAWPWQADRNASGALLRSGSHPVAKGIGMHSAARLTFTLDKPYKRFEADLGIDGRTGERGSVVFRVFAGSEERYRSPVVRGNQPRVPISVDVAGARQLSLVVDYADHGDEQDYADWLNARLLP